MIWECNGESQTDCVVISKVTETWGDLSNLHRSFPLRVGLTRVGSSEALFQAMRFPDQPDWQQEIISAPFPLRSRTEARKDGRWRSCSLPNWDAVQLDIMRWCIRVKLSQHYAEFGRLLRATRAKAIVETCTKDQYWGAVNDGEGKLIGENWVGRLLMELRNEIFERTKAGDESGLLRVPAPTTVRLKLMGQEIAEIVGRPGT